MQKFYILYQSIFISSTKVGAYKIPCSMNEKLYIRHKKKIDENITEHYHYIYLKYAKDLNNVTVLIF